MNELTPDPGEPLFETVLRLPELHDIVADAADLSLDALVDNAALDAIPAVGWVVRIARGATGLREAMWTKKILNLFAAMGPVDEATAERWRRRVESEDDLRKIGERVIAVVDAATSTIKAQLVGALLVQFLDGNCDAVTVCRTAEMIDKALTEDLVEYTNHHGDPAELPEDVQQRLIAAGLMVDRSEVVALERSEPPTTSPEGELLRRRSRP